MVGQADDENAGSPRSAEPGARRSGADDSGAVPYRDATWDDAETPEAAAAAEGVVLTPVGRVLSPLVDPAAAPRQGDEGAPAAWLELDAGVSRAAADLRVGDEILVLTWLDRGDRTALAVHPRDDPSRPPTGVFSTRSPDRPNPIGLHRARIVGVEAGGQRVRVDAIEAVDGTPVLDIKPVLGGVDDR